MLTPLRKMFYRARGHFNGSLGGVDFRLDPYHSKFWRKASQGKWEPETFRVLDQFLRPDADYLDIGAWIGPTVLYAAKKSRHVWCFEPDARAFRHLAWNLELNQLSNVSAFPIAISTEFGIARMGSFGGEAGDSMTSLLKQGNEGTNALTIPWASFVEHADLSHVSLVKMDIEGAEFSVLQDLVPWLRDTGTPLFLSTHAPYLPDPERAKKMQALADLLAFYDHCRTDRNEIPDRSKFGTDDHTNRFGSYLFFNNKA